MSGTGHQKLSEYIHTREQAPGGRAAGTNQRTTEVKLHPTTQDYQNKTGRN